MLYRRSAQLIEQALELDESTVVFKGEVVGHILPRGNYAWLNVYDGDNAIGVWCPLYMAALIKHTGSYSMRGDSVALSGVFHRECREHAGELDIHALTLEVVRSGSSIKHDVSPLKRKFAITLLVLVLMCGLFVMVRKRR
ncbi:MAG: DNA-binding protein [Candidatus Omnitrophica bacterium]|nr:DNA-binding protein [Candidatus Omnitrophota bacterium]